jgi:hypothetical protein
VILTEEVGGVVFCLETRKALILSLPIGCSHTLGGAIIGFTDVSASEHPMERGMEFDGKGKLLKATHKSEPVATVTKVPEPAADAPGQPVPETGLDQNPKQTP